ncbi:hypothetical protein AMTRI_Chr11g150320 [Amborella trichopoda]
MAIEVGTFEDIYPSRFISFHFPNPTFSLHQEPHFSSRFLRIAVLDSPHETPPHEFTVGAMVVPKTRERDWVFCTKNGHLQLLLSSQLSRLVIVSDIPINNESLSSWAFSLSRNGDPYGPHLEKSLAPLLLALTPKAMFRDGIPSVPFISYDDGVIRGLVLEQSSGPIVGDMVIENVEIDPNCKEVDFSDEKTEMSEFRRRLRFKRMPNLVQTEVPLMPLNSCSDLVAEFRLELGFLVHPYLSPMAAGLVLVSPLMEKLLNVGKGPLLLCIGVGGGALLMFLREHFEKIEILGVEIDEMVIKIAKKYFGLIEDEQLQILLGNGIEMLKYMGSKAVSNGLGPTNLVTIWHEIIASESSSCRTFLQSKIGKKLEKKGFGLSQFHVITIDVDSGDATMGLSAPPMEFIERSVLLATRLALHEHGILVLNVLPSSKSFYIDLVCSLKEFFAELYQIEVSNGENYVIIATCSVIGSIAKDGPIVEKLKQVIPRRYMDQITQI